jgi:hypothetical protein
LYSTINESQKAEFSKMLISINEGPINDSSKIEDDANDIFTLEIEMQKVNYFSHANFLLYFCK